MGLDTTALNRAMSDHERANHGVLTPVAIPESCLSDFKRRYDSIASATPDDLIVTATRIDRELGMKVASLVSAFRRENDHP